MSIVTDFETKIGPIQNYSLKKSLLEIEQAAEKIWSPSFILIKNFTGHDIRHSERVANYIINIIKIYKGEDTFSDEEIYLLAAGACLHDIGMQCDIGKKKYAEIKEIAESFGTKIDVQFSSDKSSGLSDIEQEAIRNSHNYLSAAWIKNSYTKKYRVGTHSHNDLDIACMGIPENLVMDLIDICLYHSKMDINKCSDSFLMSDERKKFIISILRFADELDINYDRISMDCYDAFRIPQENILFWWLHERTTINLDVKTGNVALYVKLHPEDATKYGKIIEHIYIDRFQEKNKSIIEILRRNNISIAFDSRCKVIFSEFAPPIRSLTEDNSKKLIRILEAEIERDLFRSELSNSIKYGSKISEERLKSHLETPEVFQGLSEEEWILVLLSAFLGMIRDVEIAGIINEDGERSLIRISVDPNYPYFARRQAVRIIALIDRPIFLKPLIVASRDSDEMVRYFAIEALGKMENINASEPLILALEDPVSFIREEAARSLVRLGNLSIKPLIGHLKDPNESVREGVACVLGGIGDRTPVKPLINLLEDKDINVCKAAIRALGSIGDQSAVESILALLLGAHDETRYEAIDALGCLGDKNTTKFIIATLKDSDINIRKQGAKSLGRLCDILSVEPL